MFYASYNPPLQEFDAILDIVQNRSGLSFYYNYLMSTQPSDFENYPKLLQKAKVRRAIHVGNVTYDDLSLPVYEHLQEDMLKSIRPWLEALLEANYKVITDDDTDGREQNRPHFKDHSEYNFQLGI